MAVNIYLSTYNHFLVLKRIDWELEEFRSSRTEGLSYNYIVHVNGSIICLNKKV